MYHVGDVSGGYSQEYGSLGYILYSISAYISQVARYPIHIYIYIFTYVFTQLQTRAQAIHFAHTAYIN